LGGQDASNPIAAFDPPQPAMDAHGGLRRVSYAGNRNARAALTHPTEACSGGSVLVV